MQPLTAQSCSRKQLGMAMPDVHLLVTGRFGTVWKFSWYTEQRVRLRDL